MTYVAPELHEVGMAEVVIQGSAFEGIDNGEFLPVGLTLEDFNE